MAIWKPQSEAPIGKHEHLGRRLFDEPMLTGAINQKPFEKLILRNFESRDLEFSLDRLGRTGIDKKVQSYLLPRANADAERFSPPRSFDGWAVIRAGFLEKPPNGPPLPLTPSPISGDGLHENIYHAHATLPESQTVDRRYLTALHIRTLFEQHGLMQPVKNAIQPAIEPISFGRRLVRALLGLFKKG